MDKKEAIRNILRETFSTFGHVREADVELRSDELAGTLIMAGPEKVGDVIRNMTPEEFSQFANEINKSGIASISRKIASLSGTQTPEPSDVSLDNEEGSSEPSGEESPEQNQLSDLGDSEVLKDL